MIGATQVAKRFLGNDVEVVEEKSEKTEEKVGTMEDTSGEVSQPIIGSTTISSREEQWIRGEVRRIIGQTFPRIQIPEMSTAQPTTTIADRALSGNEENLTKTIGLCSGSLGPSAPQAIAGSDVSVASTSNNGGTAANFSRLS